MVIPIRPLNIETDMSSIDLDDDFDFVSPLSIAQEDDDFAVIAPAQDDDFANAGKRRDADFYPTPAHVPVRFFNAFNERTGAITRLIKHSSPDWFLDPCAGGTKAATTMPYWSAIVDAGLPMQFAVACDIRDDSPAKWLKTNYLTADVKMFRPKQSPSEKPYLIASNPPFSLAREFVDKALNDVMDYGYVAMLLRLNFLGSQKRRQWWQDMPIKPQWIFIESERPSFTGDGSTDATEYAHFVWWKNPNVDNRTNLVWI